MKALRNILMVCLMFAFSCINCVVQDVFPLDLVYECSVSSVPAAQQGALLSHGWGWSVVLRVCPACRILAQLTAHRHQGAMANPQGDITLPPELLTQHFPFFSSFSQKTETNHDLSSLET